MYSSDGGTDSSKSNDADIPIFTVLSVLRLGVQTRTKKKRRTPEHSLTRTQKPFLSHGLTRTRGLYSVGFESTFKATFKVTLKVLQTS